METLIGVTTHEYVLALGGVILWQIEQLFAKKENRNILTFKKNVGRSMIWIAPIIVFDDELLAQYNALALVDYAEPPEWMYIILGFLTDIIRTKFSAKVAEAPVEQTPEQYVQCDKN